MTQDDLRDLGLNKSGTHVDFMIGADDLDIMASPPTARRSRCS